MKIYLVKIRHKGVASLYPIKADSAEKAAVEATLRAMRRYLKEITVEVDDESG